MMKPVPRAFLFTLTILIIFLFTSYCLIQSYKLWTRITTKAVDTSPIVNLNSVAIPETKETDFNSLLTTRYPKNIQQLICEDSDLINFIQRKQWLKAVEESFDGKVFLHLNDKDFGFYHQFYGGMTLHLPCDSTSSPSSSPGSPSLNNNCSTLLYYRIPNAGNQITRSLFYDFSFHFTNEEKNFQLLKCDSFDRCAHKNVHLLPPSLHLFHDFLANSCHNGTCYSFTFVREPIHRFLSGYAEIEIALGAILSNKRRETLASTGTFSNPLPLHQPKRTYHRFIEFIQFLLLKGPSSLLFREFDEQFGLFNIAPMIGTIYEAKRMAADTSGFSILHFEDYIEEWKSLSQQLHSEDLAKLVNLREMKYFQQANWQLNQSALTVASMFLSLSDEDGSMRYHHHSSSSSSHGRKLPLNNEQSNDLQPLAEKYLKILCRMYLTDFLCGDYSLPRKCQSMLGEVKDIVDGLQQQK